jgi:regulator of sigma E protease
MDAILQAVNALPTPLDDALRLLVGYLLPFAGVLLALVAVHEAGHFLAARMQGIPVTEFAVGMGPRILGFRDRHGTGWALRALPLGGYVKLSTADDLQDTTGGVALYEDRPTWSRAIVIAAGPLASLLFGVALVTVLYTAEGRRVTPPVLADVVAGSPAEQAGLKKGDTIVEMDGISVSRFEDIARIAWERPGRTFEVVFRTPEAGGETRRATLTAMAVEAESAVGTRHRIGRIGVRGGAPTIIPVSTAEALWFGISDSLSMSVAVIRGLAELLVGLRPLTELGGPVKIAEISGNAAQAGWFVLVYMTAALSINLAVLNMLPLPMLDGGQLTMLGIEAARGRKPSQRTTELVYKASFALVLVIFVLVTIKDLWELSRHL